MIVDTRPDNLYTNSMIKPTQTGFGRVFINIPGIQNDFKLYNFMKIGSVDTTLGESEHIVTYVGDIPVSVGIMRDGSKTTSTSISGILPVNTKSTLEKLVGKLFNIQVHYGACRSPKEFYSFDSVIVLNGVEIASHSLSELNALQPSERAIVQETATLKVGNYYRITMPSFENVLQQDTLGIAYIPPESCGNATEAIAALADDGDFVNIYYSFDQGITWSNVDMQVAHEGIGTQSGMIYSNERLYFTTFNADGFLFSVRAESILNGVSEYSVLHRTSAIPINHIDSGINYLWGAGGATGAYLFKLNVHTNVIDIIETGLTTSPLHSVFVLNDDVVFFGGDNANYGIYSNGTVYTSTLPNASGEDITTIQAFDYNNLIISTTNKIYRTLNGGKTWSVVANNISALEIRFIDNIVGYAFTATGVYITLDSGLSWSKVYSYTSTSVNGALIVPTDYNKIFVATTAGLQST